jgi:hypothetical protein
MTDNIERQVQIWVKAFDNVLLAIPIQFRIRVLEAVLQQQRKELGEPLIQRASEIDVRYYYETKEAISLLIQILVRSISNNASKEDAAKILYRDHHGRGTGSGWLPDYLQGLPGLKIDRERCVEISDSNGPSELTWDGAN